jgi:phage tail tube protein FII
VHVRVVVKRVQAGIGRTGTFIGIDIGMDVLQTMRKASTLSIIRLMRQDRGGMVQTAEQCQFVQNALEEFSKEQNAILASQRELHQPAHGGEAGGDDEVLYGNVTVMVDRRTSSEPVEEHLYGSVVDI